MSQEKFVRGHSKSDFMPQYYLNVLVSLVWYEAVLTGCYKIVDSIECQVIKLMKMP